MRILQLCHKPPQPSIDGGCLAMDAMTQGFLDSGAEVKVLTAATRKHPIRLENLADDYLHRTALEAVRIETQFDIRDAYVALLNGESYNISRFYAHHYAMVVKRVLSRKRYDVVHLESLYTTPYIETIRRHAPNALISMRSHNHEYQIWEQRWKASRNPLHRLVLRHLSRTLERYEKDVLNDIDTVVAISQKEAEGYRQWGYQGPIHVAGFGIDVQPHAAESIQANTAPCSPLKLFHLGAMDWGPNQEGVDWFVRSVWPELRRQHPGTELHLAGKGLDSALYGDADGVFNHGEVDDADAFNAQFDLLVVPLLRGAGIRVKIVEAMAKGIAVATTEKGASGLDLEDQQCLVHAAPEAFGSALSSLLDEPERLSLMRDNARKIVCDRFDRKQIGQRLIAFYDEYIQV